MQLRGAFTYAQVAKEQKTPGSGDCHQQKRLLSSNTHLSGGVEQELSVLLRNDDTVVRLEIEVLLAAQPQLALHNLRASKRPHVRSSRRITSS